MPIKIECGQCGKQFQARDELAGKRVKCAQCGTPITVAAGGSAATAKPPAKTATKSAAGNLAVQCSGCQARFQVGPAMAGKRVKCSKCGQPINVPSGGAPAGKPPAKRPQAEESPAAGSFGGGAVSSLLDEEFAAGTIPQVPSAGQHRCNRCGEIMAPQAVLCIKCGYDSRIGAVVEREEPVAPTRKPGENTAWGAIAAVLSILWGVVLSPIHIYFMVITFLCIWLWTESLFNPDTPQEHREALMAVGVRFPFFVVFFVADVLMVLSGINIFRGKKGAAGTMALSSSVTVSVLFFVLLLLLMQAWDSGALEEDSGSEVQQFMANTINVVLGCFGLAIAFSIPCYVLIWSKTQGRRIDLEIPEPEFARTDQIIDVTKKPTDAGQGQPSGDPPTEGSPILKEISAQATASVVIGIFSFLCLGIVGVILAPFAIYRGSKALRLIEQHNTGHQHAGTASTGKIVGIISLALHLIGILVAAVLLFGAIAAG